MHLMPHDIYMHEIPIALSSFLVILAAAVIAVALFRHLKLNPVLGYLAAGAIIGPYGLGYIHDVEQASMMAEFGVVFLLFVIGLELSWERLVAMRHHVFGLGSLQVILTAILLGLLGHYALGLAPAAALIAGGGLALSSTALVLQLVREQGERSTQLGRVSLAVLLLQDLIVIPMLVLVPLLAAEQSKIWVALGNAGLNAVGALLLTFLVGKQLLRPLFRFIASSNSPEIFSAFTLLLIVGVAAAFHSIGLSMALGAFVAGLLVAETEYKKQVEADILPYKGLLLGLFFMMVGMKIDMAFVMEHRWLLGGVVIGLVMIKTGIIWALCRSFKFSQGLSLQAALLLSQGGEFAFILFGLPESQTILGSENAALLMVAVTCSMAITPLLYAAGQWMLKTFNTQPCLAIPDQPETADLTDHVILLGFGRVGLTLAHMFSDEQVAYLALDRDPQTVARARALGHPVYFGNSAQKEVLLAAGIERAKCVVITFAHYSTALSAVVAIREVAPDLPIVARSSELEELMQLEAAGANHAISEKYESSLQLGAEAMKFIGIADAEVARLMSLYRARDYALAREQLTPASSANNGRVSFSRVKNVSTPNPQTNK